MMSEEEFEQLQRQREEYKRRHTENGSQMTNAIKLARKNYSYYWNNRVHPDEISYEEFMKEPSSFENLEAFYDGENQRFRNFIERIKNKIFK